MLEHLSDRMGAKEKKTLPSDAGKYYEVLREWSENSVLSLRPRI